MASSLVVAGAGYVQVVAAVGELVGGEPLPPGVFHGEALNVPVGVFAVPGDPLMLGCVFRGVDGFTGGGVTGFRVMPGDPTGLGAFRGLLFRGVTVRGRFGPLHRLPRRLVGRLRVGRLACLLAARNPLPGRMRGFLLPRLVTRNPLVARDPLR
jgi:hypothetical protein